MARLIQIDGKKIVAEFPLGEETTLGRSSKSTIELSDEKKASRHHAVIVRQKGEYVLVDLGSKNGTHVGDLRYRIKCLHNDEVVRVGKTRFKLDRSEEDIGAHHRPPGINVLEGDDFNLDALKSFDLESVVQEYDGVRLETDAAPTAEVRIGPAFRAARFVISAKGDSAFCQRLVQGMAMHFEHADRCAVLTIHPKHKCLFPGAGLGNVEDPEDIVLPWSVVQSVVFSKLAYVTVDSQDDLTHGPVKPGGLDRIVSFVAAPILTSKQVVGFAYADTVSRGFYFTKEDLHLMVLIGALAGELLARKRGAGEGRTERH